MTNPSARRWLLAYAISAVAFLALDLVWIALVAGPAYRAQIPHLMAASPNAAGAAAFYLLFLVGIVTFGVRPGDRDASLPRRVGAAALFGGLCYATWGLTGNAVLRDFPLGLALLDTAWGAAASAVVTAIAATVLGRLERH